MAHSKPERTSAKLSAYQEGKKWNRTFSSVVCFLLDNLGYSDDMRKFRECAYDTIANNISRHDGVFNYSVMATGSKGEGASMPLQGDHDYMFVMDDILCVENTSRCSDFYILKAERNDSVPPGYARVVAVETEAVTWTGLTCSSSVVYFTNDGQLYVSSEIFKNTLKNGQLLHHLTYDRECDNVAFNHSGPALSRTSSRSINLPGISCPGFERNTDLVYSIYFYSSLYTSKLATRLTRCDWFSPSLIDSICSTEGFIVPVGSIEGENPDLEWRISYVMTENKLIRNLNTTQFKLYVILKMIAKELINLPVISSYVVKNVVLWICELNSQVCEPNSRVCKLTSRPDLLLDLIAKCLSFMRTCIINNHLPNYVIPERNLIARRLTLESKQRLVDYLEVLLNEGRNIFCRLNIFIKHSPLSLVLAPSSVFFYGRKRDNIEKQKLQKDIFFSKRRIHLIDLNDITSMETEQLIGYWSDKRNFDINMELMDLVVPEWQTLLLSGKLQVFADLYLARIKHYLS